MSLEMRIGLLRLCVMALNGEDPRGIPVSDEKKNRALQRLREMTGQDFGYDAEKWDAWLKENKASKYY